MVVGVEDVRKLPAALLQLLFDCDGFGGVNRRSRSGLVVMHQEPIVIAPADELVHFEMRHLQ
jgi:hypothetical protein